MKMQIEPLIVATAAGPARAQCAIVEAQRGPRDVVPAAVAHMAQGDGREVRFMYSPEEAIALGQMLITCGCLASGGMPPVVAPPVASPVILNGGRG